MCIISVVDGNVKGFSYTSKHPLKWVRYNRLWDSGFMIGIYDRDLRFENIVI